MIGSARGALTSPIVMAAIALLFVNDHVLKRAAPGLVTGKLSDLAGMIFFPLLLAAAIEVAGSHRRSTIVATAFATGGVFAAIKLCGPAGDAYRIGLGVLQWPFRALSALVVGDSLPALARVQLTSDPTDLLVLPALFIPVWLVRNATRQQLVAQTLALGAANGRC